MKPYPYNFREAQRLIKEGGYEGYEFKVPSYSREGFPESNNLVEAVVGYWEKIGLRPKIFMTEWSPFRISWRAGKAHNTVAGTDTASIPECSTLLIRSEDRFASSEPRAIMHDPKIDEWFK